jgi:hypothetical protein
MPDKEKKAAKLKPPKPEEPGYETVDAPFETIIDAILEADPQTVRQREGLRTKNKTKGG